MANARNIGSGWHFQPIRHRNARLFGRAGGLYAPRGSLPNDIIASDKYYDAEQRKYNQHTNLLNKNQAKKILTHLNNAHDTKVTIRYLRQDEPTIFTQGQTIYTTPNTLLTPLGVAHEYAHTISSDESGHDTEFENNLEQVVTKLPRKYGKTPKLNEKRIIARAKNPLEQHLALSIHKTKNPQKRQELLFILKELEKAETKSDVNRWYHTYKFNLATLGQSIPYAVFAPLALGGIIIGIGFKTIPADEAVAKLGVFAIASHIGASTTKGTIKNIALLNRQKRNLYYDTLAQLQDRKDLTPLEKQKIAREASEQLTLERVKEVKSINPEIQKRLFGRQEDIATINKLGDRWDANKLSKREENEYLKANIRENKRIPTER